MISEQDTLRPGWPAPDRIRALSTTRKGGASQPPWDSLNLGVHVGDDPDHVARNRQILADFTGLAASNIGWLNQVHGTDVVELTPDNVDAVATADASFTRHPGIACAILTADCLPVILTNASGTVIGAAHAGWRSLCGGVLEHLITAMAVRPSDLKAWLGPAIGPEHFEVGPEVRQSFIDQSPDGAQAFTPNGARSGHFMADIYRLATQRLNNAGVVSVSGGGLCTVNDKDRFYSYRRDGQTGRMATLVWLD
ncbi:peptidoglycan editing factor PgeF [Marinobacter halophilus]|uniref:Purine nucleoside phosphorylase n=1 Tax=Marinobacter halophilus TaxID=1323740 RepID=A0A2T1KGE1_9GAMM|nr:peptidoglycan editing factor PgeF [Marinobacter halophilus]PSF09189.1 peptidoglycan editing factor PgeF [Marinobacter halophilus]GGC82599.1 laccase domain protein [Marinobacter halophilus]